LMLTQLPDISRDGLAEEIINLDNYFSDADPGDTISYSVSVVPPTLVGGDPLPLDFWTNMIFISGNELHITYNDYSSTQVRLPVEITVTGTSSDGVSPSLNNTFILTPDPQNTLEIRLIARQTASADRDFTSFRAEASLGSGEGGGRFQLTNSLQDMNYSIFLRDYGLDIDGTDNGDINDNLKAVRIIDTANGNAVLFTIFHSSLSDDNPMINLTEDSLSGTWTAGEGFNSTILDKFYNGDLAIRVELDGTGGTSIASGGNIKVSPEVDGISGLPSEMTQYLEGQEYVVEIWMSDLLAQVLATQTTETSNITSVLFDLLWDDTASATGISSSASGAATAFGLLSSVDTPNNFTGIVADFNGFTLLPGFATNGYARVGYATFLAQTATPNADPVEYSINITPGDDSVVRGGDIDLSQISIVNTSVTHIHPSEFFIQTDLSNVSVSGTIDLGGGVILDLDPQSGGLNNTSVSGRLDVLFDDVNNPSTIQIVDSYIDVNPTGEARPDRSLTSNYNATDLADFGLVGRQLFDVNIPFAGIRSAELSLAIRDALVQVLSSQQALDGSGNFDISENWNLTNGDLYSMVSIPSESNGVFDTGMESTAGESMTFFDPLTGAPSGLAAWSQAKLTEVSMGVYDLLIPISRRITFTTTDGYDVVLNLTGSATARFVVDQENTDEHGDTLMTATATGLSSASTGTQVYQGIIGNNSVIADPLLDVDMFTVQLNAGDSLIVDVDGDQLHTGLDSYVRIFDESGTEVTFSDDDAAPDEFYFNQGSLDSYVSFTASTTGTYYIGVSAYNDSNNPQTYDPTDTAGRPTGVIPSQVGSYDLTITVQNGAAPLHGTQSVTSETPLEEGTTVDLVVVRSQTQLDSNGQTSSLPDSDTWIDEWSSFWVEVYVETADARGITNATADLNYNTDFFTATAIEFGNAFAATGQVVIDDASGVVSGLSGAAQFEKAGNHSKALLARVKFESLEQDDVSIDFEDKFIGPHALGLSLSNVSINLTHDAETTLIVGDAPETDLWAIAYDVNDDDTINFRDLMILASVYGQNVLDTNSPYVWALDADKSGSVNFRDLSFFATNYGVHKGGDKDVIYPSNFLQRWYGHTSNITGSSSIDAVMEEALGIWQTALGLEQPLEIQLVITDLGGTQLGEGQITAVDENGRPVAGIVTLDDDAAGLGWYSEINTSAFGGGELEGGIAYTADSGSDAVGHYDLLTVLLHEIGHVAGFTETYAPFQSHVEPGVGGTLSFVGSGFEATLTEDGLHLDDTVHAGDIMNATLDPGVRKLPSILDALILQTAHQTAATGDFEILVGVTAPLNANLPDAAELNTIVETLTVLDSNVVDISNSVSEISERILPQVNLALNQLNRMSFAQDQNQLDLTVLEGLSEELISDLRLNGLSIVDSREHSRLADADLAEADFDLLGLAQEFEAGFDEIFSDWSGPIL
ncbi:MAG: pre-peptidase C-terminal domain-containing protein, partial [Planctomycetaceae bacterium]|nr:pre-peptidase C-terminal domain-containing protein [Planctomycetaceae bacterium]